MTVYVLALLTHSYVRWAIVVTALWVALRSAGGWRYGRAWSTRDQRLQKTLIALVDLQFVLGLTLYVWFSPIPKAFFADPKPAMHDSVLRFFGLEHALGMLIAVAALHVGQKRTARAATDALRQRRACTSTLLFLLLVGVSIPWPGSRHGRPLLRTPFPSASAPRSAVDCPPVFASRCATCHGERGRGDGVAGQYLHPRPRDFSDKTFLAERSDAQIIAVIHDGGALHDLSATMPPHGDLSAFELRALATCVKSLGRAAEQ